MTKDDVEATKRPDIGIDMKNIAINIFVRG